MHPPELIECLNEATFYKIDVTEAKKGQSFLVPTIYAPLLLVPTVSAPLILLPWELEIN
jgi:hypothetical protein